MFLQVVVIVLLVLINAFFAGSEIALISLNEAKLRFLAESGNIKAQLLERLRKNTSRFLATIQIGVTLAGFLASAFASESFATLLVKTLVDAGFTLDPEIIKTVSMVLITFILSLFTLVFGELVPKRVALHHADVLALFVARPLHIFSTLLNPFVTFLSFCTNMVVRLFGIKSAESGQNVTEEDIRLMVDAGGDSGTIENEEQEMIHNIFEFNDRQVAELMTHRSDIVAIPSDITVYEVFRLAAEGHFSRYPVYHENLDNIIGIMHIKDLFSFYGKEDQFNLGSIMRPPYFIPFSKPADDLFREMKITKNHMAIVLDEYGGILGLVTMEDLIEDVMGRIYDEHDEEELVIQNCDVDTYLINGIIPIEEVNDELDLALPDDEYETIGGFVIGLLGRIPEDGEHLEVSYRNLSFTVDDVQDKRIKALKLRIIAPPEDLPTQERAQRDEG
jgi:putative hemolysin